jgi:hypothetical protein
MAVGPPTLLGTCPVTTSSSSAASAEDPRTRFGLGERRLGDPELELPSPFPPVGPPAVGRAIGAMGLVIGPGPEASLSIEGPAAEAAPGAAGFAAFAGGPIGEGV